MKEQSFIVKTADIRTAAAKAVLALTHDPVMEVIVRPHVRQRTTGQNSRFWATLTEHLRGVGKEVSAISEHTGFSVWEVKRLAAQQLTPELTAILYAQSPEAVHEVLKAINGIPTSTRLGTKKFMQYEEGMTQALAEVLGTVRALAREAE